LHGNSLPFQKRNTLMMFIRAMCQPSKRRGRGGEVRSRNRRSDTPAVVLQINDKQPGVPVVCGPHPRAVFSGIFMLAGFPLSSLLAVIVGHPPNIHVFTTFSVAASVVVSESRKKLPSYIRCCSNPAYATGSLIDCACVIHPIAYRGGEPDRTAVYKENEYTPSRRGGQVVKIRCE
jgi:hypothetical protein